MPDVTHTLNAITAAAASAPFLVQPTNAGFRIGLDLANPNWWPLFREANLQQASQAEVRLNPNQQSYLLSAQTHLVEWESGSPILGAITEAQPADTASSEAIRPFGAPGEIHHYSFGEDELVTFVTDQLSAQGWHPAGQNSSAYGRWVALALIIILVISLVVAFAIY